MRSGTSLAFVLSMFIAFVAVTGADAADKPNKSKAAKANSAATEGGMRTADDDMSIILAEGVQIVTDQKSLDKRMEEHLELKTKILAETEEADRWTAKWNERTIAFNARCNHDFYQGQEQEYAECKAEQDRDMPVYNQKENEKQQIMQRALEWKSEDERLDSDKEQLNTRLQAWQRKTKDLPSSVKAAPKLDTKMKECFVDQGDLEKTVNSFQQCWDGARQAGILAIRQGTRFFDAPANPMTAEQHLQEAKDQYDAEQKARAKKYKATGNAVPSPIVPKP